MGSPLQSIRDGIVAGDWDKVCVGYNSMTGEKIEPAKTAKTTELISAEVEEYLVRHLRYAISNYRDVYPPVKAEVPVEDDLDNDEAQLKYLLADEDEDDEEEEPERPVPLVVAEPPKAAGDYDKFKVVHGAPKREDGSRIARVEDYTPAKVANRFVDDNKLAMDDIADSRAFSEKKEPQERREAVKYVNVVCSRCDKKESVTPILAPKNIDPAGKDTKSYVCNACFKGKGKRR